MKPPILPFSIEDIRANTHYYLELLRNRKERTIFKDASMSSGEKVYDGDDVVWKGPLGQFIFVINKEPYTITTKAQYIVTIKILDPIGVKLACIKMNELLLTKLIYDILKYIHNLLQTSYFSGSGFPSFHYYIPFGMEGYMIQIDENKEVYAYPDIGSQYHGYGQYVVWEDSFQYDEDADQLRDMVLSITRFGGKNPPYQYNTPIVSIPMSFNDIYSLIDSLLLVIADLSLPTDYEYPLEELYTLYNNGIDDSFDYL